MRQLLISILSHVIAHFKRNKNVSSPHRIIKQTSVLDVDLVDNNIEDKDKTQIRQYTKSMVTFLTAMGCIWITTSYILSAISMIKYGNSEPLQDLSEQVCVTILGVVISYCLKSWLETFSEKTITPYLENRLNEDSQTTTSDDEAVG